MFCSVSQGLSIFVHPPPPSIVVGHPRPSSRSRLEGSDSAKGHFPVNGTLRSLRWRPLIVERTLFLLALLSPAGSSRWAAAAAVFGGAFVGRLNANILEVNECSIHTQSQPVRSRQAQAEFAWMTNCRVRSVYLELENMLLMSLLWFLFPHTHTHAQPSVCLLPASPPTLSTRCLEFTRSWPLGEVGVIHKRMANRTAWNLLLPSRNSTDLADFFFFFFPQMLKK